MPIGLQGETVNLVFESFDASLSSQAIVINDADGNVRVLLPYERLIIDTLTADVASGITVDLLSDPEGATSTTTDNLLVSLNPDVGEFLAMKEGLNVPLGITPSVLADGAGEVKFGGVGRIIQGTTQGPNPSWQAGQPSNLLSA